MAEEKTQSKPLKYVIILLIVQCGFIITMVSPQFITNSIEKEVYYMAQMYGENEAVNIYNKAVDTTNIVVYESGLIESIRNVLLPNDYLIASETEDDGFFNTGFWLSIDNSIKGIALNVLYVFLRIYSATPWLIGMIIILTACIVSGYYQREIKKHGFEYSSPMRHGLARKMIYFLPFLLVGFLLIPIALPVYIIPIIILILSLSSNLIMANTIKRV